MHQRSSDNDPRARRSIRRPAWMPRVVEGSFAWNSLFTSARSLMTILAQLVFTPIIVKLYSPEAYGAFGFVLSMSTMLLSFFTLQYEKAFFLPTDNRDIEGLKALCNALPVYFSLLFTMVLLVGREPLMRWAGVGDIGDWIFMIPVLVIAGAWSQTSHRLVSVRYRYKEGFVYGSLVTVGAKLATILHGVLVGGHFLGLAMGELFNKIVLQVLNMRFILRDEQFLRLEHFDLRRYGWVLRKYASFPRYELPAVAMHAFSNQIPIFWLPRWFGLAQLGQYSLAMALLEMPMRLFGYSLSSTFYQKAARTHEQDGPEALARITRRMMIWTGGAGSLPLLAIGLFAEPLFTWVFGKPWSVSGAMSSALALFYFVRLVVEPVVPVLRVLKAQRAYFRLQFLLLLLRLAAVGSSIFLGMDLLPSIWLYAVANSLGYACIAVFILWRIRPPA